MARLIGSYLSDASEAVVSAAAGRVHALVLGAPGWGKSTLLRSFAARVLAPALTFSCNPTTPASRASGRPHAAALLEGREVMYVEGSLADPSLRGAVVDEIFRASDPLWDAILPVLERSRPVILATANWVAKGEHVEALKDRVALWVWLVPRLSPAEAGDVAESSLLALNGNLPGVGYSYDGWPEPDAISAVWRMAPGQKAVRAVSEAVRVLAQEAAKAGFQVNPRRVDQWARLLYGRTCLETGAEEWAEVSPVALRALQYAWPVENDADAAAWRQVVLRIVDRTGALIQAILAEVKEKLQGLSSAQPAERAAKAMELSRFISEKEAALKTLDDPRAKELRQSLDRWYRLAIQGVDPWKEGVSD